MKFTLIALVPGFLAFVWWGLTYGSRGYSDAGAVTAGLMFLSWFVSLAAVAIYWAARIVRYVFRSGR